MNATTANNVSIEKRIAVDIIGLMGLLSCGKATALDIAEQSCAMIKFGKRTLYSVERVREFIYKEAA